jgi:hypothetical protein
MRYNASCTAKPITANINDLRSAPDIPRKDRGRRGGGVGLLLLLEEAHIDSMKALLLGFIYG